MYAAPSGTEAQALLRLGGDAFARHADLVGRADETVRHLIMPVLDEDEGILWLAAHSALVASCVRKSSKSTRGYLEERLVARRARTTGALGELLDDLVSSWRRGDDPPAR